MEDKKELPDKIGKLKIYADSTIEKVSSQLEILISAKQINMLVSDNDQLRDYFQLINQQLSPQELLRNIEIRFQLIRSFKFEDSIFQLNGLNQITNLSLQFLEETTFSLSQNATLSHCLLQFQGLTTFSIHLSCKFLQNKEFQFRLNDFFKETPFLSSINYNIRTVPENSTIFYSLISGIGYVKSLKQISLNVEMCKVKSQVFIDLLEEELMYNTQIEDFKLDIGYVTFITNHDIQKVGKLLRSLKNLEKLTLSFTSSINKQVIETIKLEDDISALTNIKQLNLTFRRNLYLKFGTLFEKISELKSLESVVLDLYLLNKDLIKNYALQLGLQNNLLDQNPINANLIHNDLVQLGKSLSKISCLTQLKINFGYDFPLSIVEVIQFSAQLWPLQMLNTLQLDLSSMNTSDSDIVMSITDLKKFMDIANRLTSFHFKKYSEIQQQQDDNLNRILEFIQNGNQLEELNISMNNYFSKDLKKWQALNFIDFLKNKHCLKYVNLHFDHHLRTHYNQILSIFQGLQSNSQIQKLRLSFKYRLRITEEDFKQLHESIVKQKQLILLDLQFGPDIQISDEGLTHLSSSINQSKCLKTLILAFSKNNTSSNTVSNLIITISEIEKLRSLTLSIHGDSFGSDQESLNFGNCFAFQPKLTFLDITLEIPNLKFNNLENIFRSVESLKKIVTIKFFFKFETTQEDCVRLSGYLSNLKELRTLHLNGFSFQLLYLIKLFDFLPLLTCIDFKDEYSDMINIVKAYKKVKYYQGNNQITQKIKLKIQNKDFFINNTYEKEDAEIIVPFILKNITQITKLKLYFCMKNDVGSDYACLMYYNLRLLQNLEHIEIHIEEENQIGSESLNALGETLLELGKLRILKIIINDNNNCINWKDCSLFWKNIGNLTNLQFLEITLIFQENEYNDQSFNEETIISVFKSVSNLTKLETLKLTINYQLMTQKILDQFNIMCKSLASNLIIFSMSLLGQTEEIYQQIKQSLRKFQNLQCLKLNSKMNNIFKIKRLVNYEQSTDYYPIYDYY